MTTATTSATVAAAPPGVHPDDDQKKKSNGAISEQEQEEAEPLPQQTASFSTTLSVDGDNENNDHENNDHEPAASNETPQAVKKRQMRRGPAAVDDDGDPCTISLVLTLWSNIMFVLASCFYVVMAHVGWQFEQEVQYFSDEIYFNEDDEVWQELGYQDDYILHFGGEDGEEYAGGGIWVSKYTTFYFLAALCFLLTGFLDYIQEPGLVACIFVMAGAFGVASAVVSEKDEYLSSILNAISVHLFCIEALSHYLYRTWLNDAAIWLKNFIHFGDACWIVGSLMDVILSYIGLIRGRYSVRLAKSDVVAASLWLCCSVVYIVSTVIQVSRIFGEYRQLLQQRQQSQYERHLKIRKQHQEHQHVTPEQHIPNRGSRYAQQQQQQQQQQQRRRNSSNGYGGLSSDSSRSSNDDDYGAADTTSPRPPVPRDAIGESGHSTDTINA